MYYPNREEFMAKADKGNLVPVYSEVVADLETPVSAFKKLDTGEYSYLLESVEGGEKVGRYSFIGIDPFLIFSYQQGKVKIEEGNRVEEHRTEEPLKELEEVLDRYQPVEVDGLPRFSGGAVGYLGYELVTSFEEIPQPESGLEVPDALFMLTDTILIFDHVKHKIKIVANARVNGDPKTAYQEAVERIEGLKSRLNRSLGEQKPPISLRQKSKQNEFEFKSNLTKSEFTAKVEQAKEYIKSGDIFQVVLSQRLEVLTEAEPFDVYRSLRRVNPSPYMYYLNFADLELIGASPEMLVRVEDGNVENRPIAGTRRRGETEEEDNALAEEMLNDKKERAEHTMLVDLGRNDVGRVSRYGSVEVDEFMEIEKYSHVMHLVSNIRGELRENYSSFDALKACFPAGTVSGAPKIRAMEIISELEPTKRGPYAGAIGYFGFDGNLDSCITIRTMLFYDQKVYLQAGAGIVADSQPEAEYYETLNKAEALLAALELVD
ncbi:anthranilate synthase component I [Acetohalobium arabaticum]|uniref:Anthranilate synthase component 1 n=1 Tax=Acetohalobium arabaticum (strain ATCC 49924 / DSM 5501 / Z-7288) TaxID=574087 RepID=D9QS82_ACEAZ|nr:anthranilate synthase component I [Acetohalobium arabaticum]ADL13373.1 anthranilate synthase, component I [Acetohalobium arabaticum DSM 5501]